VSPIVKAAWMILAFAVAVGAIGVVGLLRDEDGSADFEIARTAGGWEPSTLTVERGSTVLFVNESADGAWPASDVHPTHELYPGFDAQRGVPPGQSWSYTFERAGRWGYHDHLSPETTGVVEVRE
jgi:plastocyanin